MPHAGNLETVQEAFWRGDFGNEYAVRSPGDEAANLELFRKVLSGVTLASAIELGCGTGANLRALKKLRPALALAGVEINRAAAFSAAAHQVAEIFEASLLDMEGTLAGYLRADLAFTKGVLIHIAPEDLPRAYHALYTASQRFVLIAEYYNPTPVEVPYRGHAGRLWKRDFAGELMDRYPLDLLAYGFAYHRDIHPQDDITWFLMEKR